MSNSTDAQNGESKASSKSALSGKDGVCRIEVARIDWMVSQPWQRTPQSRSSGTGFVIEGDRLLTNAHVVRSAVDIRVRQHGMTRRFPAKVVVYAPDVDLALLEIIGEKEKIDFFTCQDETNEEETVNGNTDGNGDENGTKKKKRRRRSLALEFADKLPSLQDSVHVIGFPTGGRTICVTEGVVSRIDLIQGSAFNQLLAIQVDSAINPGNSGGPAFIDGKVTGVAFCKKNKKGTDNIGYLIPIDVVRAFLGRCCLKDGTYTLSPSIPYLWHTLENKSLRLYHKVPDSVHGILLTSVCETCSSILEKGDVLTKIDGKQVADDGQVVLRGDELIQHSYILRGKHVSEPVTFSVYRAGKHITCEPVILGDIPSICKRWCDVDYRPDYLVLGALVLLPMSWSLRSSKKCGTRLISDCITWCQKWPRDWEGKEELVVLVDIFAHELSFSYGRPWRRVLAYNDVPLRSLKHLRDLWEESCASVVEGEPSFARIELEDDDDIVFEIKAAMEAQSSILETHQIPKASYISPPNPKYKHNHPIRGEGTNGKSLIVGAQANGGVNGSEK